MNYLRSHSWRLQSLALLMSVGIGSLGCAPVDASETEGAEQVLDSNAEGDGRAESGPRAGEPELAEKTAALFGFAACNANQKFELEQAVLGARWLINEALTGFHAAPNRALREKWFGPARSDSGIFELLVQMGNMANDIVRIGVRCEPSNQPLCARNYAYKLEQEGSTLHVCPAYFDYDHNAADYAPNYKVSQVGGLLHELSHFVGTKDYELIWFNLTPNYAASLFMVEWVPDMAMFNADNWRQYLMQVQ